MGVLNDVKRVRYSSWLHLFALFFYATRIIEINSFGFDFPLVAIVAVVSAFMFVLFADNLDSLKGTQSSSDFVAICSIAALVMVLFFSAILDTDNAVRELIAIFSVLLFCIHFWFLTKNSSFSTNKWILVQGKLNRFVQERRMLLIEPRRTTVREEQGDISMLEVEYIARLQGGIKTTHSNSFFDAQSSKINFEDQAYVFASSHSEASKKWTFRPPSHPGLQAFDPLVDTRLFFGMDRLRQNTLNELLICNLIQHINSGRGKDALDVLRYTSQKQIFSLQMKCVEKEQTLEPIVITHHWKIHELGMCGKHILASFDDQTRLSSRRINTMIVSILRKMNQHKPHFVLVLISFFNLLARLEQDNERAIEQKWIGAISTFSLGIHTVLEKYEDAEALHPNKKTKLSFTEIKNKISDFRQFLDVCSDGAIDQFIVAHDNYVAFFLENLPDDEKSYDVLLEQILDTMMGQLNRTQRKQRLATEGKYSFEQLIQLRTGQIIGATILIRLMTDLEKGVRS